MQRILIVIERFSSWSGWCGRGSPDGLGRLPGDIRIETDHGVFFPVVTCLMISVVLSLVIWFMRR